MGPDGSRVVQTSLDRVQAGPGTGQCHREAGLGWDRAVVAAVHITSRETRRGTVPGVIEVKKFKVQGVNNVWTRCEQVLQGEQEQGVNR
jgi:hypothetical protein